MIDPVDLTSRLVRFDTVNPPGQERSCSEFLASTLEQHAFRTQLVALGESRASLIARRGRPRGKPLVLTGHIDVVPLGTRQWSCDPFGGEIADGRVHGRGTSDMKSGVAAMVAAAVAEAANVERDMEVVLVLTAGEETGCDGARAIVEAKLLEPAGALVVGEPTANVPYVGHKGALWLKAIAEGVTAHGSMPERGDNAVYKAARAVSHLEKFDFRHAGHPVLGKPTINVGTFHGGLNINSVPDRAVIEIDLRTVPGIEHAKLRSDIASHMQENLRLETLIDLPGVWTEPGTPWVEGVRRIVTDVLGDAQEIRTATYFSDASVFGPAIGVPPTLILGPGEPQLAHQTDEWCSIERIKQATTIYRRMILDWAGQPA